MGTVFEAHSHKLTQRARRDDPSAFRAVHDAVSHRIEELGGAGTNRQRILYAADLAAAEAVLRRVINTEDRIALRYFWDELLES
jgi:hypothetical protein